MLPIQYCRFCALLLGLTTISCSTAQHSTGDPATRSRLASARQEPTEQSVTAAEDLMREHGVLRRLLLVYEESLRRLDGQKSLPPELLPCTANLIHRFIEDYHERLEEDYIFPRFSDLPQYSELVTTLRQQHDAGRRLTAEIREYSTPAYQANPANRHHLTECIHAFIVMYRPHAAREDTILFPAMHQTLTPAEYEALGQQFEAQEQQLFGQNGFEKVVAQVATLEKTLGIHHLALFTPRQ